jgi:hypothetical protein
MVVVFAPLAVGAVRLGAVVDETSSRMASFTGARETARVIVR